MIEILRKVLPQKLLDFEDKHKRQNLQELSKTSITYEKIIDTCNYVLDIHLFVQDWLSKYTDPGDCWNIASICAEFLHFKGLTPHLFSFSGGSLIYHLEVADFDGKDYRYWFVTPYNEIGHFEFSNTGWITQELWELSWFVYIKATMGIDSGFSYHGEVKDGFEVRRLIPSIHPEYPNIVQMVDLGLVRKQFEDGNYSEI